MKCKYPECHKESKGICGECREKIYPEGTPLENFLNGSGIQPETKIKEYPCSDNPEEKMVYFGGACLD